MAKNPVSEIMRNLITRAYQLLGGGEGTDLCLTEHGFETALQATSQSVSLITCGQSSGPCRPRHSLRNQAQPAWKTIPSRYLVATDDHAIPPATQEFMSSRAHAIVYKVKASHVAMISQPAATLRVILVAATAVG